MLLTMLGDGRLHLTGIVKLAPYPTRENREALLVRATYRSKRQIEELIAEVVPKPDVPALMRKLPEARPLVAPSSGAPPRPEQVGPSPRLCPDRVEPSVELRPDGVEPSMEVPPDAVDAVAAPRSSGCAVVQPLAPARYRVQFTASAKLHDKLERLRALMRPGVPDGDLAAIIEQAVTEKLERLEARRYARTRSPRKDLAETKTSPSSPHPRNRPAGGARARREPMPLCRQPRSALLRTQPARVPPSTSVWLWWTPRSAEPLPDVPRPQPVPGRARLWKTRDGEVRALGNASS